MKVSELTRPALFACEELRVGISGRAGRSISTTRYGAPPASGLTGPIPPPSGRMPICGWSAISTSAISQLVVAAQPANSMPAALRTTLRPPSQPTRYCARIWLPAENSTTTPVSSWVNPVTSRPRWMWTPSSPMTQSARIRSMSACHSANT
jgi:hypothetical protein